MLIFLQNISAEEFEEVTDILRSHVPTAALEVAEQTLRQERTFTRPPQPQFSVETFRSSYTPTRSVPLPQAMSPFYSGKTSFGGRAAVVSSPSAARAVEWCSHVYFVLQEASGLKRRRPVSPDEAVSRLPPAKRRVLPDTIVVRGNSGWLPHGNDVVFSICN